MKIWKLAVLWVPLVGSACEESASVPTEAPKAAVARLILPDSLPGHSLSSGAQEAPADAPSEYKQPTTISVRALAGFSGQTAWGQAIVQYGGTNATASVDLVSRNTLGTVLATNSGFAQDAFFLPTISTLIASTSSYVPAACGIYAQATAKGAVWMSMLNSSLSFLTWGNKSDSGADSAVQPACPPPAQPTTCPASTRLSRLDCTSPTGGGDGSTTTGGTTQPPAEPDAPVYEQPYQQRPWTEVCYTMYPGTDYERQECYRQDNNDSKLSGTSTPHSAFRGMDTSPAFAGGANLASVFVIVSDSVPTGSTAVVHRNKEGRYKNVIMVPSARLRPAELVRAMLYLNDSRAKRGETPNKNIIANLHGPIADADVSAVERDYAATFTSALVRAKRSDLGQYGTHTVMEIRLGAARSR
jgi:hypothetical protein